MKVYHSQCCHIICQYTWCEISNRDVVDNTVIKRHISSPKTKDGRKRKQQHLYVLIKHISKSVKQAIIKRGYVPHYHIKEK